MATKVLDSWALIAFFQGEPSAPEVKKILVHAETGRTHLLMTVVNWGEVYYNIMRRTSQAEAELMAREIAVMPIELVPVETDLELVRQAARYKASGKLAYADAFAAALAKTRKAELVTGDPEFESLTHDLKIHWLRARA